MDMNGILKEVISTGSNPGTHQFIFEQQFGNKVYMVTKFSDELQSELVRYNTEEKQRSTEAA